MSWDVSRRVFLRGAGLTAVGVGIAPSSLLVRTAQAAAAGDKVLVEVFLRGAADGLNICVPYGEAEYYDLRGPIALPRPGAAGGVMRLDDTFGMHPELAPLQPLYADGRLAFVHAVGNPQVGRSHFDAQDFQESGTPGQKNTATGWLDRAVARDPGQRGDAGGFLLAPSRCARFSAPSRCSSPRAWPLSTCARATGAARPRRCCAACTRRTAARSGRTRARRSRR